MKLIVYIGLLLLLASTANASIVLTKWINAWNNYKDYKMWLELLIYQVLGDFEVLLAGPLKIIIIDLWDSLVLKDTTGFVVPALAFYGVFGVSDLYVQVLQYAESYLLKLVGITVDTSNNLVAALIGGSFSVSDCTTNPAKCGITCARYPSLKY